MVLMGCFEPERLWSGSHGKKRGGSVCFEKSENKERGGVTPLAATPLFVLGSGRSGTTLLQRILNSFAGVCIWGEHGGFLKGIARSYAAFQTKVVVRHLKSLEMEGSRNRRSFENLKDPEAWGAWSNQFNRDDLKKAYRDFVNSFFLADREELRFYGFKEILYGRVRKEGLPGAPAQVADDGVPDFLKNIFPESKFVFIVRNPLEAIASAVSCFNGGDKQKVAEIAALWAGQNENLHAFHLKNKKDSIFLKYEDLIDKNKAALSALSSFLGLPLGALQCSVLDRESGRGEDPNGKKRKHLFRREEVAEIVKIVEKTAEKFGYSLDEDYFHAGA